MRARVDGRMKASPDRSEGKRRHRRTLLVLLVAACEPTAAPPARVPAQLEALTTLAATASVGTLAGPITVKVTDASGSPLSGIVVTFTLSKGSGSLSRAVDTTKAAGTATTLFTLGSAPALNEITVLVSGIAPLKLGVTGVAGSTSKLSMTTRALRFPVPKDSGFVAATPRDSFGNGTGAAVAWVARDPTLVSVTTTPNNGAVVRVLRRPGQTYLVATSGSASDSALVSVQDATSPCTFFATPSTLAVGGSIAFDAGAACIRSAAAGAEYAIVTHYNTAVTGIAAPIEVTGNGITAPSLVFPTTASAAASMIGEEPTRRDFGFELALRQRERREIGSRVAGARAWYDAARTVSAVPAPGASYATIPATVREGDLLTLNVNASDFCSNPQLRTARVAAVTNGAVVLADTSNPTGGFTDAEYRAFGVAMDTLVNPVDTTVFGAPSDIDKNGKVGILFTKAVNELTPQGSPSGVILGFYYIRDLLPKRSPFGDCPGSNESEMFYILVPDPNGTVNGNVRTKATVQNTATATVGHEYQHLINASRRMYVNDAPQVVEEVWLNEGLSHTAEELLFYRASGLAPRGNIDASSLVGGSPTRAAFDAFQGNNLARYRELLRAPESNSPFSVDDRLATRGATWSFLRYLADRTRATDGDFWHRLVNSKLTGTPNLDDVLAGTSVTAVAALRDWSISVMTDENVSGIGSAFQQPSWNFVSAMPAVGLFYALTPRVLSDGAIASVTLKGGGSAYLRFAVPQNKEALIQVTGFNGAPLPPGMRLTVVRIK
jgi:hypothetical protein